MKIDTSTLTGPALNWAVATARGFTVYHNEMLNSSVMPGFWVSGYYPGDLNSWVPLNKIAASTDWAQGGALIQQEKITVGPWDTSPFSAHYGTVDMVTSRNPRLVGPTPLIAAMRVYVSMQLGDAVEMPDELC